MKSTEGHSISVFVHTESEAFPHLGEMSRSLADLSVLRVFFLSLKKYHIRDLGSSAIPFDPSVIIIIIIIKKDSAFLTPDPHLLTWSIDFYYKTSIQTISMSDHHQIDQSFHLHRRHRGEFTEDFVRTEIERIKKMRIPFKNTTNDDRSSVVSKCFSKDHRFHSIWDYIEMEKYFLRTSNSNEAKMPSCSSYTTKPRNIIVHNNNRLHFMN